LQKLLALNSIKITQLKTMKQNTKLQLLRTIAVALFFAFALLISNPANAQRCGVNGITFTQQAGFGNNSQIMIGGFGQNDGSICFNCYSDSTVYGRSRIFNRPVGIMPPLGSPVPTWSSRIFQDLPAGILRIQTSGVNNACYDSVTWNRGLSINTSGNVGIGTDETFGFKLAVNGGIIAKNDIRTTLLGVAWPDYVFNATYVLKSLPVLEQEIDSLGHLPDMPSAQEVENEGLSLPQVSVQIVKKVEELTLYTIEQQKQLDELKKQNELLQKQNEELNALLQRLLKEKE
jgi:hypothetical protein